MVYLWNMVYQCVVWYMVYQPGVWHTCAADKERSVNDAKLSPLKYPPTVVFHTMREPQGGIGGVGGTGDGKLGLYKVPLERMTSCPL